MNTPLVLTLNESGLPIQWSTWQDVVRYKCLDIVVWEYGEHDWTKIGGTSRLTGDRSSVSFSSIVAVKCRKPPKRVVPALTNSNLFGRDRQTCGYCAKPFDRKDLTNDHIVPRSRGGEHSWMNCVTSCKRCNNKKDNKLLEETNLQLVYVPYVPTYEEALILRNRNILADQMEFLSAMLPKHSRLLV